MGTLTHGMMSWDLYRKVVDDFAGICRKERFAGELSYCNMSEPTLMRDLARYLNYAREKECFIIYFNTNASTLGRELVDTLRSTRPYTST